MVTEKGIVISKLHDNIAPTVLIRTDRSSACKSCASKESCGVGKTSKKVEIEIPNTVNANVGDVVLLSIKSNSLLKATFLIYIFPILSMLFGFSLGNCILFFKILSSSKIPIFFSFLFLIISFAGIYIIGNRLSNKNEYQPRILRIINNSKCYRT